MRDEQKDNVFRGFIALIVIGVIIGFISIGNGGTVIDGLIIHVDYGNNTILVNGLFRNKEFVVDSAEQFSTGDVCTIEWRQPKLFGDLYVKSVYCTEHVHYIQMEMYE